MVTILIPADLTEIQCLNSGKENGTGEIVRAEAESKNASSQIMDKNKKGVALPWTPPAKQEQVAAPTLLPQVAATVILAVTQLDIGTIFSFPGVTLPQLLHPTTGDLTFSTNQAALFASVVHIGAMVGSFLAGVPLVRLGQRVTLLIALPLSFATWITLYLAPTVWLILTARFVQGLCLSLMSSSTSTYVAELAHNSYRGRLMSTLDLSRQLGSLLTFALGCYTFTWRELALIFALCNSILPFIALMYLPSSPRWLAMRGRKDEAHKSLVFFRGRSYDSGNELTVILDQMRNSSHVKVTQQLKQLRDPFIFRYVIIMSCMFFLYHFTGFTVISAYIVIIMNDANVKMSSYLVAVVVAATKVIGTLFLTIIIDRINRKPLFFFTSFMCATSLALLGGYYFDQSHGQYMQSQDWLPFACLAMYAFFSSSPVLNLLRSELFPTSVRSTVVPILYTAFFIGAFLAVQTYPYLEMTLGSFGTFFIFAACNIILATIVMTTLPETRGKTLEQITEMQHRDSRSAH